MTARSRLDISGRCIVYRDPAEAIILKKVSCAEFRVTDTNRILQHGLEDRLKLSS